MRIFLYFGERKREMWSGWERREARKDETERISLAGSPKMPDRARDDSLKPERERLACATGRHRKHQHQPQCRQLLLYRRAQAERQARAERHLHRERTEGGREVSTLLEIITSPTVGNRTLPATARIAGSVFVLPECRTGRRVYSLKKNKQNKQTTGLAV